MTIPLSKEIQVWIKGYDARKAGFSRDDSTIEDKYKQEWNAGWDEADEAARIKAADPYDKGLETPDAYIVYDASGKIVKP